MADAFPVTTERLVIREFTLDDAAGVQAYAADETVVRFMPWGPNTPADTAEFLQRVVGFQTEDPRRDFEMAVTRRDTGELIGAAGLRIVRQTFREGEIGYILRRDHWGQGYMPEAVQGLCRVAFDGFDLHRLSAWTDTQNVASARVLEKCGFQLEGCLRDRIQLGGEWRDSLVYGLLAPEWRTAAAP